ncbi:ArnT family glycosyltransferase [Flavobacteriaceae bacterium LMO-SS05]
MLKTLQNNPITTIVLLVVMMLGFSISILPVSIMEARNFITAREMVTDGNWLLTTMNGVARYEKPPLPTWLTAVFGLFFGIKNIVALRFPAILMVALIGVGIYKLSKRLLGNQQHSFINALIGVTSFYVIGIIIEAPWDIFTHGFMIIALYYLFQLFQGDKLIHNYLLAGCFIGFSILSKGPISIYALFLPFLIAYGLTYKYKFSTSQITSLLASLIVALIVGGWWYLYIRLNDPEAFKAIATKETGNWGSYNVKPFYYYWSFFTQSGIWTIPAFISLLYPYLKSRVSNLKAYRFSVLWTLLAVVLLSLVPEKKARYLMPVLIPLAINIGFYIEYLIKNFKTLKDKRETIPVYFNFGLIACIGIAFPLVGFFIGPSLTGILIFWYILASVLLVSIGVLIVVYLKQKNIKTVLYLCIAFIASVLITVLPLSRIQGQSNSNASLSELKEETSKQGLNVYSMDYIAPEIIWQFGDKIPSIKNEDGKMQFPKEPKFGLLLNAISPKDRSFLESHYTLDKKELYDLNSSEPHSKKYNDRLTSDYYILTKR